MRFLTLLPAIGILLTLSACPTPTPKKSIWVTGTYTADKGCQIYAEKYKSVEQVRHAYWYDKADKTSPVTHSGFFDPVAGIECAFYMADTATGVKASGASTRITISFSNLPFIKEDKTIPIQSFDQRFKGTSVLAVFNAGMFANGLGSYQGEQGMVEVVKVKGEIVLIKFKMLMSPT